MVLLRKFCIVEKTLELIRCCILRVCLKILTCFLLAFPFFLSGKTSRQYRTLQARLYVCARVCLSLTSSSSPPPLPPPPLLLLLLVLPRVGGQLQEDQLPADATARPLRIYTHILYTSTCMDSYRVSLRHERRLLLQHPWT